MKQNKKQIEANLRNKMASQYTGKIEYLKGRIAVLEDEKATMFRHYMDEKSKRQELEDKIAMYEDWNRRLQEYMDMNDEDRKKYIENLRASEDLEQTMKLTKTFGLINHLYSLALY